MDQDWKPIFPIYLYHLGMTLPKEGNYFVVAGDGIWLHKDTGICQCFVPVENISCLDNLDANTTVSVNLPKLPAKFVWQIKHFFKTVVEKLKSESEVTLYYNKEKNQYRIYVPEQNVSYGSVKYKRIGTTHIRGMENYLCVGTIHSHCDFDAFHSGTDVDDEAEFDGLHVTFGNNDKDKFTISACVAVNGFRTKIDPTSVLDGIEKSEEFFFLSPLEETRQDWLVEAESWLVNVNPKSSTNQFLGLQNEEVELVEWSSGMKSSQLKMALGQGPFEVLSKEGDMIVVQTSAGPTRLSCCFFKIEDNS